MRPTKMYNIKITNTGVDGVMSSTSSAALHMVSQIVKKPPNLQTRVAEFVVVSYDILTTWSVL